MGLLCHPRGRLRRIVGSTRQQHSAGPGQRGANRRLPGSSSRWHCPRMGQPGSHKRTTRTYERRRHRRRILLLFRAHLGRPHRRLGRELPWSNQRSTRPDKRRSHRGRFESRGGTACRWQGRLLGAEPSRRDKCPANPAQRNVHRCLLFQQRGARGQCSTCSGQPSDLPDGSHAARAAGPAVRNPGF